MSDPAWQNIWEVLCDAQDWQDAERNLADLPNASTSYPDLLRRAYEFPRQLGSGLNILAYQMFVDPLHTAVSLHLYARELNIARKSGEALEILRVAARAYERAQDGDGRARALVQLANALYMCGGYPEAEHALEAASAYFSERQGRSGDRWFELGQAWLNSADIAMEQGEPRRALALSAQTRDLARRYELASPSGSVEQLRALTNGMLAELNCGWAYEEGLADLDAADDAYRQAQRLLERIEAIQQRPDNDRWFRLLLNQAVLELRKGNHAAAAGKLHDARQRLTGPEGEPEAAVEDWIDLLSFQMYQAILQGNTLIGQSLFKELWPRLQGMKAVLPREIQQRLQCLLFIAALPEVAHNSELARVNDAGKPDYSLLMLELNQARQDLQAALEAFDETKSNQLMVRFIIEAALAVARLAYQSGNDESGETQLRLLEAHAESFSPWQQVTARVLPLLYADSQPLEAYGYACRELAQLRDYHTLAAVQSRLGERHEALARDADSGSQERELHSRAAYAAYEAAATAVGQLRSGVQLSFQMAQLLIRYRPIYERAFALKASAQDIAGAWEWSERVRSQTLLSELLNADLYSSTYSTTTPALEQARRQLRALRALFPAPGLLRSEAPEAAAGIMEQYTQAEQEYLWLRFTHAARQHPSQPLVLDQLLDPEQTAAILPPNTALISLQLVNSPDVTDATNGLWATLIQSNGRVDLKHALNRQRPAKLLQQWEMTRGSLKKHILGPTFDDIKVLTKQLYMPLETVIKALDSSITHLIIIPDESMPVMPFHLASDGASYLFERYTISYAFSATMLAYCMDRHRQRGERPRKSLIAGWQSSPPLPRMDDELARICATLQVPAVQPGALSRDGLIDGLEQASVAHLSCHGSFLPPPGHPLFSRLRLGHDELYAHDLHGLRLNADLIVLSSCDVGQHGRGLQGMISAALTGGASGVIAAMWHVLDDDTPVMMEELYAGLARGLPAEEALRAMQLEMKRKQEKDVLRWGCFFLAGVPRITI